MGDVRKITCTQKRFDEFSIFFQILIENTFLHLVLNFGVSKVCITCTSAQTVTEIGGNRANLMRQIREMSPKRGTQSAKTQKRYEEFSIFFAQSFKIHILTSC